LIPLEHYTNGRTRWGIVSDNCPPQLLFQTLHSVMNTYRMSTAAKVTAVQTHLTQAQHTNVTWCHFIVQ